MVTVCSYCGCTISGSGPREPLQVSHGICEDCYQHYSRQWDGLTVGEYLDQFEAPVALISAEGRILAANQRFADRLGRPARALHGLLGGDALECDHARRPGGCGKTVHCQTCTIRNLVNETLATGVPRVGVEAYLEQPHHVLRMRLGARRAGDAVIVILESMEASEKAESPPTPCLSATS